jgi:uncharacterized LabA/DUF88 family protein
VASATSSSFILLPSDALISFSKSRLFILYKSKVNFGQIVKDALGGRSLIRAIAYVITTESGEEKGFFDALSKVGIETKTKNLQIFSSGAKKADWDVGMAVDAIKLAPKLDTVILVTGDGDFVPLVEYLQENQGCQVEVVSFGKSSSSKLIEATDDFLDLDSNPRRYLMIRGGSMDGIGGNGASGKRGGKGEKSQGKASQAIRAEAQRGGAHASPESIDGFENMDDAITDFGDE